jgi:hypothetical protein
VLCAIIPFIEEKRKELQIPVTPWFSPYYQACRPTPAGIDRVAVDAWIDCALNNNQNISIKHTFMFLQ